jgi:hypothetical protein
MHANLYPEIHSLKLQALLAYEKTEMHRITTIMKQGEREGNRVVTRGSFFPRLEVGGRVDLRRGVVRLKGALER